MSNILDSRLIDKLWFIAGERGLLLKSFNIMFGAYSVTYFDRRLAWELSSGMEISESDMDKILKRATITSDVYHNFAEMIQCESDKLLGRKRE
jgi:hypothetical protein